MYERDSEREHKTEIRAHNRNRCIRMIHSYAYDDNLIKYELLRCTNCARVSHLFEATI